MIKRLLTVLLLSIGLLFATAQLGCNTMEGMGEDIEGAGEGIQDAAD